MSTALTLADLHAAGAEVSGHADAWEHLIAEQGPDAVGRALVTAIDRHPGHRPTPVDIRRDLGCLTIPDAPPPRGAVTPDMILNTIDDYGNGSMLSTELRAALDVATPAAWKRTMTAIAGMVAAGTLIASGRTIRRRFSLPGRAPADTPPATPPPRPTTVTITPRTITLPSAPVPAPADSSPLTLRALLYVHRAAVVAGLDDIAGQIMTRAYALVGLED